MIVHDESFLAAIRSDPELANFTFEGVIAAKKPERYVSVTSRETRSIGRFTGPHSVVDNEYIVLGVGTTPEKAKWAREHALAKVVDVILITAGWKNRRVRFVTSRPLQRDDDPNPALWYTTDVLAFESEKL